MFSRIEKPFFVRQSLLHIEGEVNLISLDFILWDTKSVQMDGSAYTWTDVEKMPDGNSGKSPLLFLHCLSSVITAIVSFASRSS